ncbi:General secretion pathway protein C [Candidatus Burkholderia brachyanthoides]|nr:General secretion pathway protein C [Candidatus Burkholderia brachyanthoides]
MNALQTRLLMLAALALFCVTVTYWVVTLTSRQTAPLPAAAATRTPSTEQAAAIFGGQLQQANQDVHLFGILALQHGAATVVSFGGEPAKAVALGSLLADGVKLSEVRAKSIVIQRNGGAKSEIFLPQVPAGPTIYVR